MDRENARQEIRQRISCTEYLTKSKSGLYCCPFCGSGNGSHGTGGLKVYEETNTFTCFACNKSGDVIDIFQKTAGVGYNEALEALASSLGLNIDQYTPAKQPVERPQSVYSVQGGKTTPAGEKAQETATRGQEMAEYTDYYRECVKRLQDPAAVFFILQTQKKNRLHCCQRSRTMPLL